MKWRSCTTIKEQDSLAERCKKGAEAKTKGRKIEMHVWSGRGTKKQRRIRRVGRRRSRKQKQETAWVEQMLMWIGECCKCTIASSSYYPSVTALHAQYCIQFTHGANNQEPITGLVCTTIGREKAGNNTMPSKVVKASKHRTTNKAPTHNCTAQWWNYTTHRANKIC